MLDGKESTPVFLQAQADMGTVIIKQYITTMLLEHASDVLEKSRMSSPASREEKGKNKIKKE